MNSRKWISSIVAAVFVGGALGFALASLAQSKGEVSMAKASIFAAGESLRSRDLVTSMLYAHSIITHAPNAYDGYQFVGDVYSAQGYKAGAKKMYELSLERLADGGEKAMLVEAGVTSLSTARELLHRKIESLGQLNE